MDIQAVLDLRKKNPEFAANAKAWRKILDDSETKDSEALAAAVKALNAGKREG